MYVFRAVCGRARCLRWVGRGCGDERRWSYGFRDFSGLLCSAQVVWRIGRAAVAGYVLLVRWRRRRQVPTMPFRQSASTGPGRLDRRRTRSSAGRPSSSDWNLVPTRPTGVPIGGWVFACRNCVLAEWRQDVHLKHEEKMFNIKWYAAFISRMHNCSDYL